MAITFNPFAPTLPPTAAQQAQNPVIAGQAAAAQATARAERTQTRRAVTAAGKTDDNREERSATEEGAAVDSDANAVQQGTYRRRPGGLDIEV